MIVHVIWTSDVFVFPFFLFNMDQNQFQFKFWSRNSNINIHFFQKLGYWIVESRCCVKNSSDWKIMYLIKNLPLNKGKVYCTDNILHRWKINSTQLLLPIPLNKPNRNRNTFPFLKFLKIIYISQQQQIMFIFLAL